MNSPETICAACETSSLREPGGIPKKGPGLIFAKV
jgi:hypothetical protein